MTRRAIALVCVWTLPSVVCLAATAIVYSAFRIAPPDRLDAGERTRVLATLRAALEPAATDPAPPAVHRPLGGPATRSPASTRRAPTWQRRPWMPRASCAWIAGSRR
jgi:hypothetical protein